MDDRVIEARRGDLELTTDRSRVDVAATLAMLHDTHWAGGMERAELERAIRNSLCVSVFEGPRQIAFARAVTDLATFAYLTDVIVHAEFRGRGIGSWMVECYLTHPELQHLRRIALLTRDAQALYTKYGFQVGVTTSSTYMELRPLPNSGFHSFVEPSHH